MQATLITVSLISIRHQCWRNHQCGLC